MAGSSELDVNHDGVIGHASVSKPWQMDEMVSIVLARSKIKDKPLSFLLHEVQFQVDEEDLRTVMLEDIIFAKELFPKGLPSRADRSVDEQEVTSELILSGALDSQGPMEAMRSLLVRAKSKQRRRILTMDLKTMRATAESYLVMSPQVRKLLMQRAAESEDERLELIAEIDKQTREIGFEDFKELWLVQSIVEGTKDSKVTSSEPGLEPKVSRKKKLKKKLAQAPEGEVINPTFKR
eukprot:SAG11_NODE_3022_length_2757_cov_1.220843_2_plen_237_part_00